MFEVIKKVKEINFERRIKADNHTFTGKSYFNDELEKNKNLELDFIIAKPRMAYYMRYSTNIYNIYLKYVSSDDIFVYSIDEIFADVTSYLKTYKMTARELVTKMVQNVYEETGITATAGIGTNMYLAKIAMDIVAKHMKPNDNGVRIAELDEMSYRKMLWGHTPITDFWRVGRGYSKRLAENKMYTMGDVARCSLENEDLLYKIFGVNAELLIDHAWGYENTLMKDVKEYKPESNSISSGQVLHEPYDYEKTELIIKEMAELLALDLTKKNLETNKIVITIGYDTINLTDDKIRKKYNGEITLDRYERAVPKHSHGTINLGLPTSSTKIIRENAVKLFERIANKDLYVRRLNITAEDVKKADDKSKDNFEQINLFEEDDEKENIEKIKKEKRLQTTMVNLKNKYGKNAILKGMNFEEGGTTIERNSEIGGHHE